MVSNTKIVNKISTNLKLIGFALEYFSGRWFALINSQIKNTIEITQNTIRISFITILL